MPQYTYYVFGTGFEEYTSCSRWKAMCFADDMSDKFKADITIMKQHNITGYKEIIKHESS
jgi:hypothetical protein